MTKAILLTVCILSLTGRAHALEGGPARSPGMMKEDGPRMEDLSDIKFEYDAKSDLFKNAEEAKEFQALFDKYKTSKEITDRFAKVADEKQNKMIAMRKEGKRPDFAKMDEERAAEKFSLLKEIKSILEKKKKDNIAAVALNEDVKCGGGKNLPVIEKATSDSLKDSSKVVKIMLTEEEFAKIKKDIKDEVKKEMMKEMADKPREEMKRGDDKPRGEDREKSRDDEDRPKMAEGRGKDKGRKQMGGGRGGRGGEEEMNVDMFSSQMASQMGNQMGGQMNSQMNSQMNMGSQMKMGGNQMSRDQMMQQQLRIPQLNYNQPYQNQMAVNQMQYQGQMNNNQMGRPQRPQMNQNQNYAYQNQNYGYASYQSNTDQNYGQAAYNFMAPQMEYGYTGNSMMPAQYQQSPSFSQYSSFTGF